MNRRRFIAITAAGAAWRPGRARATAPVEWRGVALGAAASLTIDHEDRTEARRLLVASLAELDRLEHIFSLYRPDSALARLNRDGRLEAPPLDLITLLAEARHYWELSAGAFDPTVQPLWAIHAAHFARPGADPTGPPAAAIEAARALVDFGTVAIDSAAIAFARPGVALTLNGIAQGYVTDRVADLLRRGGLRRVLVDMGEIRGLGHSWQVGLEGGGALVLDDGAVATSAPDGTRFSPCCHHLFDPATGRSAAAPRAVTVVAETATAADALSTILAVRSGLAPRRLPGVRQTLVWR